MGQVIPIMQKRTFSLDEARELLPIVRRITDDAVRRFEILEDDLILGLIPQEDNTKLEDIVDHWVDQIEKLGCEAKGLWLVDFDNGSGYYCWKHEEDDIAHFHSYETGYDGRLPIN